MKVLPKVLLMVTAFLVVACTAPLIEVFVAGDHYTGGGGQGQPYDYITFYYNGQAAFKAVDLYIDGEPCGWEVTDSAKNAVFSISAGGSIPDTPHDYAGYPFEIKEYVGGGGQPISTTGTVPHSVFE